MQRWFREICKKHHNRVLFYPKFTYTDLDNMSEVYRKQWEKKIEPHQYVTLSQPNCPDLLAKIKALLELDAVPCLISPRMHSDRAKSVSQYVKQHTPSPEEALVILTSGTTAIPKGVRLSHTNLLSHTEMLRKHVSHDIFSEHDRTFSFLPWTHSYGLLGECFSVLDRGASMGVLSPHTQLQFRFPYFFKDFHWTRPTILFVVPHLLEQMKTQNRRLKEFISSADIRRHILFGKNIQWVVCGGAKLDPDVRAELWHDLKIPILQGYGCTEMSPMISLQNNFDVDDTSVGELLPGVEVEIAPDNEILVRGDNKFLGYIGPGDTGYYHPTGDLGYVRDNKLYLTGRKSNMVKLQNGKFIDITDLEQTLRQRMPDCREICLWVREDHQIVGVAQFQHENIIQHHFYFKVMGEMIRIYRTNVPFTSINDGTLTEKREICRRAVQEKFTKDLSFL